MSVLRWSRLRWGPLAALVLAVTLVSVLALRAPDLGAGSARGNGEPGALWIDPGALAALPTSGPAWAGLQARADGDIGRADVADQDSFHDTDTLAVALVAARTGRDEYRRRAVGHLLDAIDTDRNPDATCPVAPSRARSLAIGRNLPAYVIAADLVGLRHDGVPGSDGSRFAAWVDRLRRQDNCPHLAEDRGPSTLAADHERSASNVSVMAGGARLAAAIYLGDTAEVEDVWRTFRRFTGAEAGGELRFTREGLTWAHDADAPMAVNPAGTTRDGRRIDGVIPNDQGRGGPFAWPPGYTQYPWEGLQGLYVQAQLLAQAGYPAYEAGDRALLRALDYQHHLWRATGDPRWWDRADWVKHLANAAYATDYPITGDADRGRNMAWTDWTHAQMAQPASTSS